METAYETLNPIIQRTTTLDKFKLKKGNRFINEAHVKALIDSIKKHNLLHLQPIIVDTNMNVIDGQHRLKAAERLQVPIYYVIAADVSFDDIILGNYPLTTGK